MSTALSLSVAQLGDTKGNATHALTIGKKTANLTTEAALVASASFRTLFMQSVPSMLAFEKAKHGNYRAAVEIMSLVAAKAVVQLLEPAPIKDVNGTRPGQWKKGSVITLAEQVMKKEAGAKGFTKKQLLVRSLATAIIEGLDKAPPADAPNGGTPSGIPGIDGPAPQ
jgi:hypothetical protein